MVKQDFCPHFPGQGGSILTRHESIFGKICWNYYSFHYRVYLLGVLFSILILAGIKGNKGKIRQKIPLYSKRNQPECSKKYRITSVVLTMPTNFCPSTTGKAWKSTRINKCATSPTVQLSGTDVGLDIITSSKVSISNMVLSISFSFSNIFPKLKRITSV